MIVEQAVFTSAHTRRMRGYHLVGRSPGIDENLARQLIHWCPTHGSLAATSPDAWSLNCFPLEDDWFAVTRSVYGGPEYSRRGGLQVVTQILVLRKRQFAGYDQNPLALAKTAWILGHLRLTLETPAHLPTVDLPDHPLPDYEAMFEPTSSDWILLRQLQRSLGQHRRVAVRGLREPIKAIEFLLQQYPSSQRLQLSFTSGLKPSVERPFQIHLVPSGAELSRNRLAQLGIHAISA